MANDSDTIKTGNSETQSSRRQFIRNMAIAGSGIAASLAGTSAVAGSDSAQGCSTAVVGNNTRKLGALTVSPIGLGCMSMSSGSYNPPRRAKDAALTDK